MHNKSIIYHWNKSVTILYLGNSYFTIIYSYQKSQQGLALAAFDFKNDQNISILRCSASNLGRGLLSQVIFDVEK